MTNEIYILLLIIFCGCAFLNVTLFFLVKELFNVLGRVIDLELQTKNLKYLEKKIFQHESEIYFLKNRLNEMSEAKNEK